MFDGARLHAGPYSFPYNLVTLLAVLFDEGLMMQCLSRLCISSISSHVPCCSSLCKDLAVHCSCE
jgi:hypothetical protein